MELREEGESPGSLVVPGRALLMLGLALLGQRPRLLAVTLLRQGRSSRPGPKERFSAVRPVKQLPLRGLPFPDLQTL